MECNFDAIYRVLPSTARRVAHDFMSGTKSQRQNRECTGRKIQMLDHRNTKQECQPIYRGARNGLPEHSNVYRLAYILHV
jgi:hypothetical protein